jgi:DNA-directed RNA polymerase subunit RPC12/RpoP
VSGAALEIRCDSCGAELAVEAHLRTARCPYCDSTSVVERPPSADRPDPTFGLGFVVARDAAVERVRRWLSSRHLLAHSGLRGAALEKTSGVYVPAYLYGAVADAEYTARIGENYTVTETYVTTNSKGNTVVRTRTRTETEWRSLAGSYGGYVLDVLVTASRGIPNEELEAIEPFDLRALLRYQPAMLAGWIAEDPSLSREECLRLAHDEAVEDIEERLGDFMPGDSHRDLRHRTTLRDEVIDLVLLPVWVFAARYDPEKPPVRLLVNGQTGEVQGKVPLSVPKVAAAGVLALLLLVGVVLIFLFLARGGH